MKTIMIFIDDEDYESVRLTKAVLGYTWRQYIIKASQLFEKMLEEEEKKLLRED